MERIRYIGKQGKRIYVFNQIVNVYILQIFALSLVTLNVCKIHMWTYMYSTNHVYLHRPNAFGFLANACYQTLKRVSNFSELA